MRKTNYWSNRIGCYFSMFYLRPHSWQANEVTDCFFGPICLKEAQQLVEQKHLSELCECCCCNKCDLTAECAQNTLTKSRFRQFVWWLDFSIKMCRGYVNKMWVLVISRVSCIYIYRLYGLCYWSFLGPLLLIPSWCPVPLQEGIDSKGPRRDQ